MKGYVYLLEDIEEKRYIGSTNDINRRFGEHLRKHSNSRYTKSGKGWKMTYYEEYDTLTEARKVEKEIKRNKRFRKEFYKRAEKFKNYGA